MFGKNKEELDIDKLEIEASIRLKEIEAIDTASNAEIASQITALETQQARPLRELLLDSTNEYAKNKMTEIDAQIAELRKGLVW